MERAFSPSLLDCLKPGVTPQAGRASRLQRSNYSGIRYLDAPKARSAQAWECNPRILLPQAKGLKERSIIGFETASAAGVFC